MSSYDNWKCTDPALEGAEDWVRECEAYEDSPEYATDLEKWLKEAREEEPDEEWTEDDYIDSAAFENIIEQRLKDGY
jgi:hypothetical protein